MKQAAPDSQAAEALAIEMLAWLAAEPELLGRFLALTGIEPAGIRDAAREPGFLAGVMRFVLAHEPTLMAFAAASGHPPEAVGRALRSLPTGDDTHLAST